MKNIMNIVRSDMIIRNGDKKKYIPLLISVCLFSCLLCFLVSSLYGTMFPMLFASMVVTFLFGKESKYNSRKLYSVLPVKKSDTVNSGFLSGFVIYFSVSLAVYLIVLAMLVNMVIIGESEHDMISRLSAAAGVSETGIFNLLYAASFSFGMVLLSNQIKTGLLKPAAFSGKIRKADSSDKRAAALGGALVVFILLLASGVIKVTPLYILAAILSKLASLMDGMLLSGLCILIGAALSGYNYICTLLEYEISEQ